MFFISYVHLIYSLNATFSYFHLTEGTLGFLHRVRTRTTRLTLVTFFPIKFKISYSLLRVFMYMTHLIHSPVPFLLHHLSGIVLNTLLPLCVILSAVVEILHVTC